MTHVVGIEKEGMPAELHELLLNKVGNGRLARAGQAGEPQHSRLLALQARMGFAADIEMLAMDVVRSAQREVQHSAGNCRVTELVDVHFIFRMVDCGRNGLGTELQPITAAGEQRLVRHPYDRRLELIGNLGRVIRRRDHVAA